MISRYFHIYSVGGGSNILHRPTGDSEAVDIIEVVVGNSVIVTLLVVVSV